jgi:hypothetical protein
VQSILGGISMKRLALAISANTRNNMNGVIGGGQPEIPLDGPIFRNTGAESAIDGFVGRAGPGAHNSRALVSLG